MISKKGWDSVERSESGSGHKKTPLLMEGLKLIKSYTIRDKLSRK
jgi:hypothetical protein